MGLKYGAVLLTALLGLWPLAVQARPPEFTGLLPLSEVIAAALERRPGKFLEAELEETPAGLIYEIEILGKDHVIYKLKFTADTGRFLGEEED